jgi:hypothetical protein
VGVTEQVDEVLAGIAQGYRWSRWLLAVVIHELHERRLVVASPIKARTSRLGPADRNTGALSAVNPELIRAFPRWS